MALDSSNVDVAVTGAVSYATTATAAPTDADTPLPEPAWSDVGYIGEDGVVEARERSTNNIVAWQGAKVVRSVVTDAVMTVQFVMIETNPASVALFYGSEVEGTDGSVEIDPAATGGRRSIVVDYVDGDKFVRLYLPTAEVMEVGEITLASGEPVGYDVTITAYFDDTLGYSGKKWFSDLVEES